MKRAANIISGFANTVVKRSGRHLKFRFQVESGYRPARSSAHGVFSLAARSSYFRRRKITHKFVLTEVLKEQLAAWLKSSTPKSAIRLTDNEIDVVVEWSDREIHSHGNTFSSMPSEAHDIRSNPVWKVLKDKEREQLAAVPPGISRMIFLCDAGCSLLRDVNPIGGHHATVSGQQVIRTFLAESAIDGVFVFTPGHQNRSLIHTWSDHLIWRLFIFDRRDGITEAEYAKVIAVKNLLPVPFLESYEARSWHQQGMFDPQGRGQYLSSQWISSGTGVDIVKISSRGIQEYLAGRLNHEQFKYFTGAELFELSLKEGKTISGIKFEPSGTEHDDDYIVFEFAPDPCAMPFRMPEIIEEETITRPICSEEKE